MIKNIVFDIGNVLMKFSWKQYITSLFSDPKDVELVEASMWHTGLWDQLDVNVMTEEEIFAGMRAHNPAIADKVDLALANVYKCFAKEAYAIPWIKELKAAGYKVYFLSNYSPFAMRQNQECLDFLPEMDGGIFSCDVHVIKPEPGIYELLFKKYNLIPEECVFLDDRESNVETARKLGMAGIVFTNYQEGRAQLEELLKK